MTELELRISKYLDGELAKHELVELHAHLAKNPDAMLVYREMIAIRQAARRTPSLRAPLRASEHQLFERLRREGFGGTYARGGHSISPFTSESPEASLSSHGSSRSMIVSPDDGRRPRRRAVAFASALVASVVTIIAAVNYGSDSPSTVADRGEVRTSRVRDGLGDGVRGSEGSRVRGDARSDSSSVGVASAHGGEPVTARAVSVARVRRPDVHVASFVNSIAPLKDVEVNSNDALIDGDSTSDPVPANDSSQPNEFAEHSTDSLRGAEPSNANLALGNDADAIAPAVLPVPSDGDSRDALVSASFRYGASFIAASTARSEDLSIGVELNVGNGHHLALLGGRSAAVTEQRASNTHSVPARAAIGDAKDDGMALLRTNEVPAPYDLEVDQEWWLGAGYSFSVEPIDRFEVSAGVHGGVGARALHVGGDVAFRMHVTRTIALELSPTIAHVIPHNRDHNEFAIESMSDGYLYDAESEQKSFSTYGASIGVRIDLQ